MLCNPKATPSVIHWSTAWTVWESFRVLSPKMSQPMKPAPHPTHVAKCPYQMPTVQNGRGLRPSHLNGRSMINLRFIPEISRNSHLFTHFSLIFHWGIPSNPVLKAAPWQRMAVRTAAPRVVWAPDLEVGCLDPLGFVAVNTLSFQGAHCSWQQRYVPRILCTSGPIIRWCRNRLKSTVDLLDHMRTKFNVQWQMHFALQSRNWKSSVVKQPIAAFIFA